ncbi:MAG: glycosyltransferase family 2 protein, partial [Leptolyngbya sp. SIO3F4]|nr:glycosyltransferase family 2 protein [Leptolyngbya sp. SIO3F4]
VVTYVPQAPNHWSDLAYFMLRWSDTWEVESLLHFQQKWDLDMDQYFLQRYKQLGYCRRQTLLYPLLHQLTKGRTMIWLERLVIDIERRLNQIMTDRHARIINDTIRKLVPTRVSPHRKSSTIRKLLWLVHRRKATTQLSRPHLMPH